MAVIVISEAENLINFSFLNIQPTQLVRKQLNKASGFHKNI